MPQDLTVPQDVSQEMWQTPAAHLSKENYVCDDYIFEFENDYIFMFANEVNAKTTIDLDDVLEAAAFSDEVERKSSIPRGMTYLVHQGKVMNEKKTNNRTKQHWNRNCD